MRNRSFFILLLTLLFHGHVLAQERKLYVDQFSSILGSPQKEAQLLAFAEKHQIDELILYELHKVHRHSPLDQTQTNEPLAHFIRRAKTKHGIKSISASGESGEFFKTIIHPYNRSRSLSHELIDVYNIEFEYWNTKQILDGGYYCQTYLSKEGSPCTRESAFNHFLNSLETMRALADEEAIEVKIEAYLGHFRRNEADAISKHIDRLLLHDYVHLPRYSYLYVKDRLNYLDAVHSHIEISILFSEENHFMGDWLHNHDFHEAEQAFFRQLEKNDIQLEQHLNLHGFAYFNYSFFKNNEPKKFKDWAF